MTSISSFTASITVALMALLMPGAGPPPTRMPRRLRGVFIAFTYPLTRAARRSVSSTIMLHLSILTSPGDSTSHHQPGILRTPPLGHCHQPAYQSSPPTPLCLKSVMSLCSQSTCHCRLGENNNNLSSEMQGASSDILFRSDVGLLT